MRRQQTKCGWKYIVWHFLISGFSFICRFIKLLFLLIVSSSINPKSCKLFPFSLSHSLVLMKLSQNLWDFHHECEWNELIEGWSLKRLSMFEFVCVGAWVGKKRIIRVSTFFNSYRLYVPFVLLIGGSVKQAEGGGEGVGELVGVKNLIVWWFGKLT